MKTEGKLVSEKQISHICRSRDWKDAVHQALDPFFQAGIAPAEYEKTVIEQIENLGPYCILRPGLALIHGPASETIKKTGLHIARCDQPVFFNETSPPVTLMIAVCAPDKPQYLALISQLAARLRGQYTAKYLETLTDEQLLAHFESVFKLLH
ncbi:PTS sugar transporter subunit IIA [Erysipelotrichaceae bacterium 51-3]